MATLSANAQALKKKNEANRLKAWYTTNTPIPTTWASNMEPSGFNSTTTTPTKPTTSTASQAMKDEVAARKAANAKIVEANNKAAGLNITPTPTSTTTWTTENTRTGGVETTNSGTPMNQGNYSIQDKQKMWEDAGNTGAYKEDAYVRDPKTGLLSMKKEYVGKFTDAGSTVVGAPTTEAEAATNVSDAARTSAMENAKAKETLTTTTQEAIDAAQKEADVTGKANEEYYKNLAAAQSTRLDELKAENEEYAAMKQKQADKAVETLQPLLDIQKAADKAAIDEAEARDKAAVMKMEREAEVAASRMRIKFSKVGGSFGGAAAAMFQTVYDEGAAKIVELKMKGVKEIADLKLEAWKTEYKYQKEINDIIDKTADETFKYKTETKDKILAVQSDVLLSNKEKDIAIAKALSDYKDKKLELQTNLFSNVDKLNQNIDRDLKNIQSQLTVRQTAWKNEVSSKIASGAWDKMTPEEKQRLANDSGMSIKEIETLKASTTYKMVDAAVAALMPWEILSANSAKILTDSVNSFIARWDSLDIAIAKALKQNKDTLPEFVNYQKKLEAKKASDAEKVRLDNEKTKAEIAKLQAEAKAEWLKTFTDDITWDTFSYDAVSWTVKNLMTWEETIVWTGWNLYQKMTASTNPIGVYATWDMDWSRHAAIYETAQKEWLDAFINKYKGTKITSDMVMKTAEKYWVDPLMIAATMALDSSMGTKGKWARNNNPWNIGQFDSLDAQWITVEGYKTLQEGIDAVGNNLAKRQKALWVPSKTRDEIRKEQAEARMLKDMSEDEKKVYNFEKVLGNDKSSLQDVFNAAKANWIKSEPSYYLPKLGIAQSEEIAKKNWADLYFEVERDDKGNSIYTINSIRQWDEIFSLGWDWAYTPINDYEEVVEWVNEAGNTEEFPMSKAKKEWITIRDILSASSKITKNVPNPFDISSNVQSFIKWFGKAWELLNK